MSVLPGHNSDLAPGMSQVIESGEKYTITDDKGQELQLEGKDRPWVIEFLSSFDHYMDVSATLPPNHPYVESAATAMREVWFKIPDDLRDQMPSYRALGVRLSKHDHQA